MKNLSGYLLHLLIKQHSQVLGVHTYIGQNELPTLDTRQPQTTLASNSFIESLTSSEAATFYPNDPGWNSELHNISNQ